MDAIIIADSGSESVSATNRLKLSVDGHIANIQVVKNFIHNNGRVVAPVEGDGVSSWASSLKLNGIFLYSYLSEQGFDVELIDGYFNERDIFIEMLKQNPKAIVISTAFIMSKKTLHHLVSDIRSLAPDIFIIAGGQFVHLSKRIREKLMSDNQIMAIYNNEYIFLDETDEPQVDLYIISACGETILSDALRILKEGGNPEGLPNTATYGGKRYLFSRRVDDIRKTGGVTVNWERMPAKFFRSGVVPMQASYGCPYDCTFCNFMKDSRLMGVKPLENLIEELKAVQQRGARYVWFVDDNFRLGKNDLEKVCRRFLTEGINVKWKSFIRVNAMKDMDMDLLKAAGCVEVLLGMESADAGLLANMNKKADPEIYADVTERVLRAGINCSCYFIFGFPGETIETATRTRKFIQEIEYPHLDGYIYFTLFPFIIAPLSPISEPMNAQKYGLKGFMFKWEHNTMNFEEARIHAIKSFFELETSGIIYHGDNLDMLLGLPPRQRKDFIARRHKIAKMSAKGLLKEEEMVREFKDVL
jgi:anaerobic magnesium-protoporphyrin IX monomethyl ester cyclase